MAINRQQAEKKELETITQQQLCASKEGAPTVTRKGESRTLGKGFYITLGLLLTLVVSWIRCNEKFVVSDFSMKTWARNLSMTENEVSMGKWYVPTAGHDLDTADPAHLTEINHKKCLPNSTHCLQTAKPCIVHTEPHEQNIVKVKHVKTAPLIVNPITGKNEGLVTKWFTSSEICTLVDIADPGDLIEINRGKYQHWGVYAGKSKLTNGVLTDESFIVHFGLDNNAPPSDRPRYKIFNPTINCKSLQAVVGNSKVRINNAHDQLLWRKPTRDINEMNIRIKSFIDLGKPYHLFQHNCEAFAQYCRYGVTLSQQAALLCLTMSGITASWACELITGPATVWERTAVAFIIELSELAMLLGEKTATFGLRLEVIFLIETPFVVYMWTLKSSGLAQSLVSAIYLVVIASEVCYFVLVAKLLSAAVAIGASYLAHLVYYGNGMTRTICGIDLPSLVNLIGMTYVVHHSTLTWVLHGIELPAWVYMLLLDFVASVIGLKYVTVIFILPVMCYTFGLTYSACWVVLTVLPVLSFKLKA